MDDATWTYVWLCVELPFVLFHVSVLACVFRCMWKRRLCGGFFKVYTVQSIVELLMYCLQIRMRLVRLGFLHVLFTVGVHRYLVLVDTHLSYFQMLMHTLIAVNRYLLVVRPFSPMDREWHGRRFAAVLLAMVVIALPGASVALCCPQYSAVPSGTPGVYLTVCSEKWVYAGINVAQLVYSTTTTTACFVLEVRTLMEYRKYNAVARRLHHHEYRLLLFSVLQLAGQMLMTSRSMSLIIVLYLLGGNRVLMLIIQTTQTYMVDIICLTAPISLMVTSKKVRKEYSQFFFRR